MKNLYNLYHTSFFEILVCIFDTSRLFGGFLRKFVRRIPLRIFSEESSENRYRTEASGNNMSTVSTTDRALR